MSAPAPLCAYCSDHALGPLATCEICGRGIDGEVLWCCGMTLDLECYGLHHAEEHPG